MCFAPGTSEEVMDAVNRLLHGPYGSRYQNGPRWSNTASGPTGNVGDPITLTYSFVPDGTIVAETTRNPDTPSNLFAFLNGLYGSPAVWQGLYAQVLQRWGQLSGITFIYEPNDDGARLPDNPGVLGVRGDLRFSGIFIDGPSSVLAYNYYPNFGDMAIDTGDTFYNNTAANSIGLRNVLAHEIGHGLGMAHVCPITQSKLMEPTVSTAYDGPRHDDVRLAHYYYGDHFEPNNDQSQATLISGLQVSSPVVIGTPPLPATNSASQTSISQEGDEDWFRFSTTGSRRLTASLVPLGFTYDDSPQACTGQTASCCSGNIINSSMMANLGLEVRRTSTIALSNSAGPGGVETITGALLPIAAEYYVRVFASDMPTQSQLYQIELSVVESSLTLSVSPPALLAPGVPTDLIITAIGDLQSILAGSVKLVYRIDGGSFSTVTATPLGGGQFRATFPGFPCNSVITYYVEAIGTGGGTANTTVRRPFGAPANLYTSFVDTATTVFADDFETDTGWSATIVRTPGTTGTLTGIWQRVDPNGTAAAPEDDHTPPPGTHCYVTENGPPGGAVGAADIDNGTTFLTSPVFSLSGYNNATISYWRWYSNSVGSAPFADVMLVELSDNNGASWTTVETVGPIQNASGGWIFHSFNMSDFPSIAMTASMRLRFTASDLDIGSVVEAAVDDVLITGFACTNLCIADVDNGSGTGVPDGGVTIEDLLYYLFIFDAGLPTADVDDGSATGTPDGGVTIEDLLYYLFRFDSGC